MSIEEEMVYTSELILNYESSINNVINNNLNVETDKTDEKLLYSEELKVICSKHVECY